MTHRLLTELNLEFLSLNGGCIGSSESTLVKMPHCWKSHVADYINLQKDLHNTVRGVALTRHPLSI